MFFTVLFSYQYPDENPLKSFASSIISSNNETAKEYKKQLSEITSADW